MFISAANRKFFGDFLNRTCHTFGHILQQRSGHTEAKPKYCVKKCLFRVFFSSPHDVKIISKYFF